MDAPLAIVLAAGKGSRMNSELPKVLCKAAGRPLIDYVLESLRAAGVGRLVVVVGFEAKMVQDHLKGQFTNIQFAIQEKQLGTGHAVMMCQELVSNHEGACIVVAGDSPMLQPTSVQKLLSDFDQSNPACILGTLIHEDPTGLGRIVRNGSGDFEEIVEEKDATDEQRKICEVNMSTYVFDCQKMLSSLDRLTDDNRQKEYYITDIPAILLSDGEDVRALPVLHTVEALSVNTVEQLANVEKAILQQNK